MQILKATIFVNFDQGLLSHTLQFDAPSFEGRLVQLMLDRPSGIFGRVIIRGVSSGNRMVLLPEGGINTANMRLADIRLDLPVDPGLRLEVNYDVSQHVPQPGIDVYAVIHTAPERASAPVYDLGLTLRPR
jgi:hypothetical protein